MFIIFNKDGSIFAKTQSDYVMQGSNRVNKVYVGFVDNDYYQWTCNGVFNLPNGTRWTVPGVSVREGFDYLGVNYKGWTIDLTDDITKYDGKVSLTVQVVNSDTAVLFTYLANITINRTGLPIDGYWDNSITVAQFNDYMAQLAVKLQANTVSVVVSENDLPDVGEKNILYFVVGESSNTPYQVKMWNGSEYVLLGTINLSSFASKEEQELFENAINEQIAQIRNEVVNPFVMVDTESDLPSTDEGKIYVVVDTESWYYWNGSAYVNGGTFAQVALDAINVIFDGTESGLYANNVQSAIDELVVEKLDKDGYSALAHVGLADNIASPDGITDNAEFSFRASGGTASIADGFAEIKRLKGRTWIVNQLQKISTNATYTDSETGLTITNNGDGSIRISGTILATKSSSIYITQPVDMTTLTGQTYLTMLGNSSPYLTFRIDGQNNSNMAEGVDNKIWVGTADRINASNIYMGVTGGVGQTIDITIKPKTINLTKMFGPGKEPSTVAQFNNLTRNINLDTYNEGAFVNMNAEALESVGFNAFDGELEQGGLNQGIATIGNSFVRSKNFILVVCGETYTFVESETSNKWKNRYVAMYDKDYNWIRDIGFGNSVSGYGTPYTYALDTKCCFIKIFYYAEQPITPNDFSNICFHLTHSGYRNGQYEPYVKNTRTFYDVETYFPSGMRSAGSAYDEMTPKKAVQNIANDDLGTLDWQYAGANIFYATLSDAYPCDDYTKADIVCSLYETKSRSDLANKVISLSQNVVVIQDNDFNNATAFKQAMVGVMFNYKLAEPIIYDIDTDEEWTYPVSDFGTEKAVDGAFLSADIFYMNNLRDKLRNLPDIPKCSETGTHVLKCINGTYTWVEE